MADTLDRSTLMLGILHDLAAIRPLPENPFRAPEDDQRVTIPVRDVRFLNDLLARARAVVDGAAPAPRLSEVLLDGERAKLAYIGKPPADVTVFINHYAPLVDVIQAVERQGGDPLPVLREAIIGLCDFATRQASEYLKLMARTVSPPPVP